MNPERVDHTAIVVRDIDVAVARYEALLGVSATAPQEIPDQRVKICFLTIGDTSIELICPTDDTSGVARFLLKRGEGLHHIGIVVDDIESELRQLEREGVRLIDREARSTPHGLIAFVHPEATSGVLLELVQH